MLLCMLEVLSSLSGWYGRSRNWHSRRRLENLPAPQEPSENGFPRRFHGSLKMHRLNAHQRQRAAASQQAFCARAARMMNVLFKRLPQPRVFLRFDVFESHKLAVQLSFRFPAQNVSQATCHAGTEIQSQRPKNDGHASGHVLAPVLTEPFNNRKRATVAHRKAFTGAARNKKLARRRAIKHGVPRENVAATRSRLPRGDGNRSAGQSLPDLIVRFAVELDRDTLGQESSKTLSRGAAKFLADRVIANAAIFLSPHQFSAQACAHAAVRILNRSRHALHGERGIEMNRIFERGHVQAWFLLWINAVGRRNRHHQERIHSRPCPQPVVPARKLPQRAHAKLRQPMAHFLRERLEIGNRHFRLALEPRSEFLVLRSDSHWARVQMALPRHHASNGQQRRRAEAELIGSQNCRKHNVPRKFQASVHTEREA